MPISQTKPQCLCMFYTQPHGKLDCALAKAKAHQLPAKRAILPSYLKEAR